MELKKHIKIGIKKVMEDEELAKELDERLESINKVFGDLDNITIQTLALLEKSIKSEGFLYLVRLNRVIDDLQLNNNKFNEIEAVTSFISIVTSLLLIGGYSDEHDETKMNGQNISFL